MPVIAIALGAMALLLMVYFARFHHHPADIWSAPAAWLRAGIYFCFCMVVASASGALQATLSSPVVYPDQWTDPGWWLSTVVLVIFILAAYWGYWYRNTLRFGRKLDPLPQLVFGLCWGVTTGLLLLSFWHIAADIGHGRPLWLTWLLAYGMISVWQGLWMDMYWDLYVSPQHDTPASKLAKLPRTHIPNITLSLTYFAVYQNYWLFITLQTIAMLAATFGMRMPAPWNRAPTPPATPVRGLFGLPRAGGHMPTEKADR